MVEFLTATIYALVDKDECGKDVIALEEYQEKLKAYQAWFKRDWFACYTLLSCMHDDLLGEFEHYPTAKYMWDRLKIRFG